MQNFGLSVKETKKEDEMTSEVSPRKIRSYACRYLIVLVSKVIKIITDNIRELISSRRFYDVCVAQSLDVENVCFRLFSA